MKDLYILKIASQGNLLDNFFTKPILFLLSKCLLLLSRSPRISPECFCDELVSALLLLNVIRKNYF